MFEDNRDVMVRDQLIARGIDDPGVLKAMRKVERHQFVDKSDQVHSYDDRPIFIGSGQTISQPYMVAIMTQCLGLTGDEKLLEIGTGSGYQTAILAELAREVVTIERISDLLDRAEKLLTGMGYENIKFITGDGTLGSAQHSPFDRIIVTAGAPHVPKILLKQLVKGGRMVVPVGGRFSQELKVIKKEQRGETSVKRKCGCMFVPLIGKDGWKSSEPDIKTNK